MAIINDGMKEETLSSVYLKSPVSQLDEETLSPEDIAWADSCVNKDVDALDWSSMKDALLEIFSSQPESPANFSVAHSMQSGADEILHFRENLTSMEFGSGINKNEDLIGDGFEEIKSLEDDEDDLIFRNKRDQARGKVLHSVYRPNYSEEVKAENLDSDLNSNLTTHEMDPSSEGIFKVWDLGVPDEQDDFANQLNKALADVPPEIESSTSDSAALKDLMDVSIDDLIAGIGDLSLMQNTE